MNETILWPVLEEHLDEAEFLFERREAALDAPDYVLSELEAGPEARLRAHVDGLVVGGPAVVEQLLLPVLHDPDKVHGSVVAAALACSAGGREGIAAVLRAIDEGEAEREDHWGAMALALGRSEDPQLQSMLLDSLATAPAHGVAARLTALTALGVPLGPGLLAHLHSPDLCVLRAAASQAGLYLDQALLQVLGPLAQAEDPELRRRTLDAALCHQVPGAWEAIRYWAFSPDPAPADPSIPPALLTEITASPTRRHAMTRVALLGNADAHDQLLALLEHEPLRADVLWAAGFCGRVAAVDAAVSLLADEHLGPLAGEVVCAIAGLAPDAEGYWLPRPLDDDPDEALPSFEADDLEADLDTEPEEALPLPNPEAISAWWAANRANFDPGLRHLQGRVFDHQALLAAMHDGPLRRRHALAFEVAVRSGGQYHVDTRGPVPRQRAQLQALGSAPLIYQRGLPGR